MKERISRKDFSKLIALGLVLGTGSKILGKPRPAKKDKFQTVTVLGAGLSGLYTAYVLENAGYDVTVVEAAANPGGRMQTWYINNLYFGELGGEWIEEKHSFVKSIATVLGLKLESKKFHQDFFDPSGLLERDKNQISPGAKIIIKKLYSNYSSMSRKQKEGLDKVDILTYLNYQGADYSDLEKLERKYSPEFAESLNFISAEKAIPNIYRGESDSRTFYRIQGGSTQLIDSLKSKISLSNFIFSDPALGISQDENSVKVELKSGRIISSDACVCTLPPQLLLKLKWTPDLPRDLRFSLLQIKSSRTTKILAQCTGINFAFQLTGRGGIQSITGEEIDAGKGMVSIQSSSGRLSDFRSLPEDYLKLELSQKLTDIEYLIGVEIKQMKVKFWEDDEFARGGVSVFSPGTFEARLNLKKNFERVFFAGEHLGKEETGTMNSAISSALDAVEMISGA